MKDFLFECPYMITSFHADVRQYQVNVTAYNAVSYEGRSVEVVVTLPPGRNPLKLNHSIQ
jgi:hypothetical protein